MNKFVKRPKDQIKAGMKGKYDKLGLLENPFPSNPIVNKDSTNDRINGNIYESEIRKEEYNKVKDKFLLSPQSDLNHLRLGYIIDQSYVGRGNGKSAFLINLVRRINSNYCLDISKNVNKCFGLYIEPEPGGRFESILSSRIIDTSLAMLKLSSVLELYPEVAIDSSAEDEDELIKNLNGINWYEENKIDLRKIITHYLKNEHLQDLPSDFPLYKDAGRLLMYLTTQEDLKEYYRALKNTSMKLEFVYSHLVSIFLAAGFNGAYAFIDDFERIPDFQSARQKRDFAFELRNCIFDGTYKNSIYGFLNFLLVLHAGVPRLISEPWEESGMEHRAPISSQIEADHIITFEKISLKHGRLLIKKYIEKYRIQTSMDELLPFTKEAIKKICSLSELNAAKILRTAYQLVESASLEKDITLIDQEYVEKLSSSGVLVSEEDEKISDIKTVDLMSKADKE